MHHITASFFFSKMELYLLLLFATFTVLIVTVFSHV
jgi:hypothetical protein